MWKITQRSVAANKIRFALTALAIVLGVGFVSSANVLSDGLRASFGSLTEEIVQGTDLQVERADGEDVPLTSEEVAALNEVDGIRIAVGEYGVGNEVFPVRGDGSLVRPEGPPVFANSWNPDEQLNPATIETGRVPVGPNEWVVDLGTAEREGFVVGETYDLVAPTDEGFVQAELVGTFRFGAENQTNGAVLLAFDPEAAPGIFNVEDFGAVTIAIDGTRSLTDVRADVEALFSESYVVADTADLNAETTAEFNSAISSFAWVLRIFALIALFVSIFIIANTFNIVMSQRIRELGLLRAVGATPKQVRRAVMGEALIVGILASIVGLGVGVALAYGVEAALNGIGAELPPFDKPLSITTIAIGMAVGVVVTLISAWIPARRAGKTSPITAISGTDGLTASASQRSTIFGGILTLLGAALTAVALFGGIESTGTLLGLLGVGAAILMIGITLLSSLVAAPISRALGVPLAAVYKRPGFLAKENAARNPKRTATTAAALMIGLSLVSMAFVVGQTLKSDLNSLLETTVAADYAAFPATNGLIPDAVVADLEASSEISDVVGLRYWSTDVNGIEDIEIGATQFDSIDTVLNLDLIEGSYASIDDESAAIWEDFATENGIALGDEVSVVLEDGSTADLTIEAVFADGNIFEGLLVTDARWDTIGDQEQFDWVAINGAGEDLALADNAIAALEDSYPQVILQSAADYRAEITGQVDVLLMIVTGFLGLAILIAFIGIINTMALSTFERTRELGLLRAVGMTRKQMHKMVRWEAAIVSSVGAIFGAVVGVVFAVLIVVATPDYVLQNLSIPWLSLVGLVVVAGLIGLVAGFMPARRAGKLNVLDAIAS